MSPQLKQEINDYLNSFGDYELDYDEMKELFTRSNDLLVQVLTEDEEENFDDPRLTEKQKEELYGKTN